MLVDEMPVQTIGFQCRNCGECCGPIPFTKNSAVKPLVLAMGI